MEIGLVATAQISSVYDDLLNYLVEKATPQEILAYQIAENVEERAVELLEKSNAGTLTSEEAAELEQMRYVDKLVSVLKARALEALSKS
jgi:trans-aconitate methyltransferase